MCRLHHIVLAVCVAVSALFYAAQAVELPDSSWVALPDATEASVGSLLASDRRDPIEGIWATTTDGSVVAVTAGLSRGGSRTMADTYLMILIDSPHPAIVPGTVMGVLSPLAKPGHYDAEIFTSRKSDRLCKPARFTLSLADRAHITMKEVHSGVKVSFTIRIPYLSRFRVTRVDDRPDDLDGLIRRWPADECAPNKIRRL